MINQKIRELDDLRSKSQSIKSIDYSKDYMQIKFSGDAPFVNLIGRIIELEGEINAEIDTFVDEKHKIINQIQALKNNKYIEILYKHYVEFKRLEVIAVEMSFSYDYIRHLHKYALWDFENKILKNFKIFEKRHKITHNNT